MREVLPIFLPPWVIQDGNYGDFKVGDEYAFALEFHALVRLKATPMAPKKGAYLTYRGNAQYDVVGAERLHAGDNWWVADFGVPAYTLGSCVDSSESPMWLSGKIVLEVDPFPYFERLSKLPSAPPLIFDWRIERIERRASLDGKKSPSFHVSQVYNAGASNSDWHAVTATTAWDDPLGIDYLLHCKKISAEPRHTLDK